MPYLYNGLGVHRRSLVIDEFDDHWVYDLDTQCIVCGGPLALDGVCDECFDCEECADEPPWDDEDDGWPGGEEGGEG